MSRLLMGAAVATLFLSASALAQTTVAAAPSNTPAATDHETAKNEIVCKKMKVTGQLLPGPKICHTRGEWEEISRQSQYQIEQAQQRPGAHGGS